MNVHDSEQLAELLNGRGVQACQGRRKGRSHNRKYLQHQGKGGTEGNQRGGEAQKPQGGQSRPADGDRAAAWPRGKGLQLLRKVRGLDFVFGTQAIARVPEILRKVGEGSGPIIDVRLNGEAGSIGIFAVPPRKKISAFRQHHAGLRQLLRVLRRALPAGKRNQPGHGKRPRRGQPAGRSRHQGGHAPGPEREFVREVFRLRTGVSPPC